MKHWLGCLTILGLMAGCTQVPVEPAGPSVAQCPAPPASSPAPRTPIAMSCPACPVCAGEIPPTPVPPPAEAFQAAQWADLPEWQRDDLAAAWPGLLASCRAIRAASVKAAWVEPCEAARALGEKPTREAIRGFLENHLQPWAVTNADGSREGLITGYYEPLIQGSRWKSAKNAVPVYAVPSDMLQLDLGEVYPETKSLRLRGRLEERKVLPYWSRAQIDAQGEGFPAKVLLWAADPIEFFFLQIQGSGQVALADGSRVRIAYADQNGHPYRSIGRWLIDQGELTLAQASMQGIQKWAGANPQRLHELLNVNPSYVFFREEAVPVIDGKPAGPKGSLGVPLEATRAIAIDPRSIPLGAPVFIAFQMPDGTPMQRLVMAQDTGGAIRGRVRADFFWGFGKEAGAQAGKMRQQGKLWLLWPRNAALPAVAQ
ncbi:MAG: murein transglycosylase [Candidatus Dactylopiibacterium carminicum]|uniref:peptidoglycan lytic exotransglycosylase n=1 Tax=Candidatus Dactylopiibacterium carminicum TaxID=857335 RepID=A0A272EX28_9RHOO|nr:murein transglycosylase A [Candidatus Dactylopiibacterium carminicum]KAF7600295.1 murein transglycosylase [Candidatus Dactylopiibacterium carminicum]PAS94651.1 MAG: murein transglycosylase [Candidatus Dactylopiibacterium carminicum]PAS96939.1 MAG: murein transglycosylase [Candidatus Dactylopiibacterium carminicum]PAT00296.1 MAG: murein transglycosylase [Candidatus Dactylopiibacterium carminicum]